MRRFQFIVCKVMQKEAYLCAARAKNIVDVVIIPQGMHEQSDKLRETIQKALEQSHDYRDRRYDASLLGFGLCSNGIAGLSAKIPLVVPRAHDCITLLIGSREKYRKYLETHQGVYWFSAGWADAENQPGEKNHEKKLKEYIEKYGEQNTMYLLETELAWTKRYKWATYIDWGFKTAGEDEQYTRRCAKYFGWNYDRIKGNATLMQQLVDGRWDGKNFLIVQPGEKIEQNLTKNELIKAT